MTIREQILIELERTAISLLIDKKYKLKEEFEQKLINYAEYEKHVWLINTEINCLCSN